MARARVKKTATKAAPKKAEKEMKVMKTTKKVTLPKPLHASVRSTAETVNVKESEKVLRRRSSDEDVDRVKKAKLSHISDAQLQVAVGPNGEDVDSFIKAGLKSHHAKNKNLARDFWKGFYEIFPFDCKLSHALENPAVMEAVDEALLDVMAACHEGNPCDRSVAPLEKYFLNRPSELNPSELFGLFHAMFPCATMDVHTAEKMQFQVLKAISVMNFQERFPNWWDAIKDALETSLVAELLVNLDQINLRFWVVALRDVLAQFVPLDSLDAVQRAVNEEADPPVTHLRILLQTKIGGVMYRNHAEKLEWNTFIQSIDARLDDLENNDFEVGETRNFKQLMNQEVKRFDAKQLRAWKIKEAKHAYMASWVMMPVSIPADQWIDKHNARLETVLVNCNLVARMPWDVLICGGEEAKLPGIRETVELHGPVVAQMNNVRQAACSLLPEGGRGGTVQSWIKAFDNKEAKASLLKMCPSFNVTLTFLRTRVHDVLTELHQGKILATFPVKVKDAKIPAQREALRQMQGETLALALGESGSRDIKIALSLLGCVENAQDLCVHDPCTKSSFYFKCREKLETYHFTMAEVQAKKPPVLLFGQKALEYDFKQWQQKVAKGKNPTQKDLNPFCAFSYLLKPELYKILKEWNTSAMRKFSHSLLHEVQPCLEDGIDEMEEMCEAEHKSSSSSSCVAVVPSTVPSRAQTKKDVKAASQKTTKQASMMKFFQVK